MSVGVLFAQVPNANLEDGSENEISNWTIESGSAGIYATQKFRAYTMDTVVAAEQGQYFGVLEYNGNEPGIISTRFPLNRRADGMRMKLIYLNEKEDQRLGIQMIYTRWNADSTRRDTVMTYTDLINTRDVEGFPYYDWLDYELELLPAYFEMNGNPDSCSIRLYNDRGIETDKGAVLMFDELRLNDGVINSLQDLTEIEVNMYPNPVSQGILTIEVEEASLIRFLDLNGRVLETHRVRRAKNIIKTQLPTGSYVMWVENATGRSARMLFVH